MILHASAHRLPLKDESVHCVVTSPPYFGLRNYKLPPQIWPDGWRGSLGLEPTPELYIEHLLTVFREVKRVLRPDGTCWINIGDCYASQGGPIHQGKGINDLLGGKQETQDYNKSRVAPNGLKPKDLCGIPWRVALALQADGWWLRSDIIWSKSNPMPESVTDRPTRSHEYVFLLAKREQYFYDAEAVKEQGTSGPSDCRKMEESLPRIGGKHKDLIDALSKASCATNIGQKRAVGSPIRHQRTVWTIPTVPYAGAHFATFPAKLVEPCILAGTSQKGVCSTCGAPWARVIDTQYQEAGRGNNNMAHKGASYQETGAARPYETRMLRHTTTLGWKPTCRCNAGDPVPAICLDPFGGSGTVGQVCERLGRRWVSVDLAYHDLAKARTAQRGLVL